MGDINHRLGNSETDEIGLNTNEVKSLFYHNFVTTQTIDLQEFLNKTKITTGTLFAVSGYQDNYAGVQIGSITEDRMASATDGGWYGGTSQTQHTIRAIQWNNSSTPRVYFQIEPKNEVPFTSLSIQTDATTPSPYTKTVFRLSYASFSSATGAWSWNTSVGSTNSLGYGNNLTRYIEIN